MNTKVFANVDDLSTTHCHLAWPTAASMAAAMAKTVSASLIDGGVGGVGVGGVGGVGGVAGVPSTRVVFVSVGGLCSRLASGKI